MDAEAVAWIHYRLEEDRILQLAAMWMGLKSVMWSEVSQRKAIQSGLVLMWSIKKHPEGMKNGQCEQLLSVTYKMKFIEKK